jgi:hypothetical protein
MNEVKKVTVQVRPPRGNFSGEIAEGWYCIVDGFLVMTDQDGKPIDGEKHYLGPEDDARLKACRLVRSKCRNGAAPIGWGHKLNYPKIRY